MLRQGAPKATPKTPKYLVDFTLLAWKPGMENSLGLNPKRPLCIISLITHTCSV